MRVLAIAIYIIVVLIRINIVKTPHLDENTKSLIFIFATILIPTFLIRPIFNSSHKNLKPLKYPDLENSLELPKGTKIYTKKSFFNNGIYVKGNLTKNSIVIDPILLNSLKLEELRFLIYHEIAHIKNKDITKLQFLFALVYGAHPILLVLISGFIDFKTTTHLIIYITLSVMLYFTGILLYFLCKRNRELECDSFASKHTNSQIGISALNTLNDMGIIKDTKLILFSDHPNLDKRIKNLKSS